MMQEGTGDGPEKRREERGNDANLAAKDYCLRHSTKSGATGEGAGAWIKTIQDGLALIGSSIVSIGTVWLALYYTVVVHYVPNVDFGKLTTVIGIVGVTGTVLVIFLVATLSSSALPFALRDTKWESINKLQARNFVGTLSRSYLINGYTYFHFLLLTIAVAIIFSVAIKCYERFNGPWIIGSLLLATIVDVLVITWFERNRSSSGKVRTYFGDVRTYASSAAFFFLSFPVTFSFGRDLVRQQDDWWKIVLFVALVPSLISLLTLGIGWVKAALVVIFALLLLSPTLTASILAVPARLINIGSEQRNVTVRTSGAWLALTECGARWEPNKKTKMPFNPKHHFKVFVLSDLGDDFIIKCRDRAVRISNNEVAQGTILFP